MRFRTGLLVGLAVGYYHGTRAGRERFDQIERWLDRIRSTTTFQEARTKLSDGLREITTATLHLALGGSGGAGPPGTGAQPAPGAGRRSPPTASSPAAPDGRRGHSPSR